MRGGQGQVSRGQTPPEPSLLCYNVLTLASLRPQSLRLCRRAQGRGRRELSGWGRGVHGRWSPEMVGRWEDAWVGERANGQGAGGTGVMGRNRWMGGRQWPPNSTQGRTAGGGSWRLVNHSRLHCEMFWPNGPEQILSVRGQRQKAGEVSIQEGQGPTDPWHTPQSWEGHPRAPAAATAPRPHATYLVGVDDGDEPGEQAAEEGHQHGLHHVVLGQRPVLHRGGRRHATQGAVVLRGHGPRAVSDGGSRPPTPTPA